MELPFGTKFDFASIMKRQLEAEKKYKTNAATGSDKLVNSVFYEKSIKYLYSTVNNIKSDNSKPEMKSFFLALERTKGDYKKRETKIYNKVALLASFIDQQIRRDPEGILTHSLLGVYVEMWDFVNNPQTVGIFKKSFDIVDKKGEDNTAITIFKLAYFSTVFALELATIHLVEFELDIYNGKDPKDSIQDIMKKHASYMKNIVFPMIQILAFFKNTKNLVTVITKISSEEDAAKAKTGKESVTAVAATVGAFLTASVPGIGISVIAGIIIILLGIIPLIRCIIYWSKTMEIDTGKELELRSELLDNNILGLKEKLEETTDEKERKRLEEVIAKQEEYVEKWRARSKKILTSENEANYMTETTIQKEDDSNYDQQNDFEVVL